MIHNSSVNIRLIHFLLWIKRSPQSPNFETFESSGKNLPNSSFSKPEVSFSSNFASLFSFTRHNSSMLFQLKFYILSTKGDYQSTNLVKFHVSSRRSEILDFDMHRPGQSFYRMPSHVYHQYEVGHTHMEQGIRSRTSGYTELGIRSRTPRYSKYGIRNRTPVYTKQGILSRTPGYMEQAGPNLDKECFRLSDASPLS